MGSKDISLKPKIELVRVSSSERAKIPLNPIQLSLNYKHFRSQTYLRVINEIKQLRKHQLLHRSHQESKETFGKQLQSRCSRWLPSYFKPSRKLSKGKSSHSKSFDDINRISVIHRAPTSNSESCLAILLVSQPPEENPHPKLVRLTSSERDVSKVAPTGPPRSSSRRHGGISGFLRRLSPNLRRSKSPPPFLLDEHNSYLSDQSFESKALASPPQKKLFSSIFKSQKSGSKLLRPEDQEVAFEQTSNEQSLTVAQTDFQNRPVMEESGIDKPVAAAKHASGKQKKVDSQARIAHTATSVTVTSLDSNLATAQRPYTLNLCGKGHIIVHDEKKVISTASQPALTQPCPNLYSALSCLAPSIDSIGTCSLDVAATGTTSPTTMGFKSRENSPAHLAFSRSRDSSPMRPEWKAYSADKNLSPQTTVLKIRQLKEQLARCAKEIGNDIERGRQGSVRRRDGNQITNRSVSVDRGYLSKVKQCVVNGHGDHKLRLESETYRCSIQDGARINGNEPVTYAKSFIQQRIERLYGPGALAVNFKTKQKVLETQTKEYHSHSNGDNSLLPEDLPSVFRHLRPEFRHQLPVKTINKLRRNSYTEKNRSETYSSINNFSLNSHGDSTSDSDRLESSKLFFKSEVSGTTNERLPSEKERTTVGVTCDSTIVSDDQITNKDLSSNKSSENKDGHYFLKLVDNEVKIIERKVEILESDLEKNSHLMTEEVKGKVLATIGKAKLLLSQKIKQFIGLCHKNLNGSSYEEFPTTFEDLQGFWDMVYIQIDDVQKFFSEMHSLKQQNWKELDYLPVLSCKKPPTGVITIKGKVNRGINKSKEASEIRKAKDEARRKMIEEKRKAMKQLKKAQDNVEIFVPEDK